MRPTIRSACAGVNVYTNFPCEFSTGDRIQFTHNNKDLNVHNRDRGRIEAIGNDNRLTVKMDDGRTVNFDPARMRTSITAMPLPATVPRV